jgi:hypothetical protein
VWEVRQRRLTQRNNLLRQLEDRFAHAVALADQNLKYWTECHRTLRKRLRREERRLKKANRLHDNLHAELAEKQQQMPPGSQTLQRLDREQKMQFHSVQGLTQRVANSKNLLWWIDQHGRTLYRRRCVMRLQQKDTMERVEWALQEGNTVLRIAANLQSRASTFPSAKVGIAIPWLRKYATKALDYLAQLDALQEALVAEDLHRLLEHEKGLLALDSLLSELSQALEADSAYHAERTACDHLAIKTPHGSADAVWVNELALLLKRKQTQLQTAVIDGLKVGLEARLNEEDGRLNKVAAYPTDKPTFTLPDMSVITTESVKMIEPFSKKRHITVTKVLPVIFAQPWLVQQAWDDVHLEESLSSKELMLDLLQKELAGFRLRQEDANKKELDLKQKIQDLGVEIEVHSAAIAVNETSDEMEERLMKKATFQKELMKTEAELAMTKEINVANKTASVPTSQGIENVTKEIMTTKAHIEKRVKERHFLSENFFKLEMEHYQTFQVLYVFFWSLCCDFT